MNRIPKILHMYWDKGPMSKLQVFTVESFHKLNPDWEIFVHTPIQEYTAGANYIPEYTGDDYFYMIGEMSYVKQIETDIASLNIDVNLHNILRSDIFRYHILHKEGGMWADFDIIWLKPMTHMNSIKSVGKVPVQEMGATACLRNMATGHHNIGVLFGTPSHGLYKALINKAMKIQALRRDRHAHQAFGVTLWASLYPTLRDITNMHPDVVGIPYETFAPYSIENMAGLYKQNDLSFINDPNVIGLHWFNGHILSKEYINNNLFNKNTECSMTTILNQLGYTNA